MREAQVLIYTFIAIFRVVSFLVLRLKWLKSNTVRWNKAMCAIKKKNKIRSNINILSFIAILNNFFIDTNFDYL